MYHFTVQDVEATASGCETCCCERLALKPGTTSKVTVAYAPWAVPIGRLHCVPIFELEQKDTCPVNSGAPVASGPVAFDTPLNTLLSGDLNTTITDPQAGALTFKLLSLYGPKHGTLALAADGTFDYTPLNNYQGPDRFFVTATDPTNQSKVFEVLIGVGSTSSSTMTETPHVSVDPSQAVVNYQFYTVSFPVKVSPAADLCEVWRLTVLQAALDCDCICYNRTDCFDIGITKC